METSNSVVALTGEKNVKGFVLNAIHKLCGDQGPQEGLHVVESGLNGAIHLHFDDCAHPANLIDSLIRKGDVLAQLCKGGIKIFDPRYIEESERNNFLCALKVEIKGVENPKDLSSITEEILSVFNWTEAARLCGGEMSFMQGRRLRGSNEKKGVRFQSIHKGKIKLTVQWGGNETCYEYLLVPPDGARMHALVEAVKYAIANPQKNVRRRKYVLPDHFRSSAEKALSIIAPDIGAQNPIGNSKGLAEDEADDDVDNDPISDGRGSFINLGSTEIGLILLAVYDEGYDLEKPIPKSEFTRILQKELALVDPVPQVLGGLVKRLANSHHRVIEYVRGAAGADSITGYILTHNAKKILAKLNSEKDAAAITTSVADEAPTESSLDSVIGDQLSPTAAPISLTPAEVMQGVVSLYALKEERESLNLRQKNLMMEHETLLTCIKVVVQDLSATEVKLVDLNEKISELQGSKSIMDAINLLTK